MVAQSDMFEAGRPLPLLRLGTRKRPRRWGTPSYTRVVAVQSSRTYAGRVDSDDFDAVLAKVSNASSADREVREKLHILANIEARKATDQWWKLAHRV